MEIDFDELHQITSLQEINILAKNFNLELHEAESLTVAEFDINVVDSIVPATKYDSIIKVIEVVILGNNGKNFANVKIMYTFEVKKENSYLTLKEGEYRIDPRLNHWLDNIVIATTRGIMFSEFRGTFLDKILLPLIKPV